MKEGMKEGFKEVLANIEAGPLAVTPEAISTETMEKVLASVEMGPLVARV